MAAKTWGPCACGCGEEITHEGSSYAGADEATRNRHRAKAAYKRRQGGGQAMPGTREALADLGLVDDVPTADLAGVIASAAAELARRVAGLDSAAVARELDKGLEASRAAVEEAQSRAAKAEMRVAKLSDELAAAVERADQADADAVMAGERAEQTRTLCDAVEVQLNDEIEQHRAYAIKTNETIVELRREKQEAQDRANRAEALLPQAEARFAAEQKTALAELRAELTERLGELRAELATSRAEAAAERSRAERAEKAGAPAEVVKAPQTRTRPSRAKKPLQVSEAEPGK